MFKASRKIREFERLASSLQQECSGHVSSVAVYGGRRRDDELLKMRGRAFHCGRNDERYAQY